jgi:hypothetical protein
LCLTGYDQMNIDRWVQDSAVTLALNGLRVVEVKLLEGTGGGEVEIPISEISPYHRYLGVRFYLVRGVEGVEQSAPNLVGETLRVFILFLSQAAAFDYVEAGLFPELKMVIDAQDGPLRALNESEYNKGFTGYVYRALKPVHVRLQRWFPGICHLHFAVRKIVISCFLVCCMMTLCFIVGVVEAFLLSRRVVKPTFTPMDDLVDAAPSGADGDKVPKGVHSLNPPWELGVTPQPAGVKLRRPERRVAEQAKGKTKRKAVVHAINRVYRRTFDGKEYDVYEVQMEGQNGEPNYLQEYFFRRDEDISDDEMRVWNDIDEQWDNYERERDYNDYTRIGKKIGEDILEIVRMRMEKAETKAKLRGPNPKADVDRRTMDKQAAPLDGDSDSDEPVLRPETKKFDCDAQLKFSMGKLKKVTDPISKNLEVVTQSSFQMDDEKVKKVNNSVVRMCKDKKPVVTGFVAKFGDLTIPKEFADATRFLMWPSPNHITHGNPFKTMMDPRGMITVEHLVDGNWKSVSFVPEILLAPSGPVGITSSDWCIMALPAELNSKTALAIGVSDDLNPTWLTSAVSGATGPEHKAIKLGVATQLGMFAYSVDTKPGDSGSPLYQIQGEQIVAVGMHVALCEANGVGLAVNWDAAPHFQHRQL